MLDHEIEIRRSRTQERFDGGGTDPVTTRVDALLSRIEQDNVRASPEVFLLNLPRTGEHR
jgi:hypothetical protein